jgi:predicted DNA-binding transcriptional regulator AlpA
MVRSDLTFQRPSDIDSIRMALYSTPQAAKKLGLSLITLNRYIAAKKVPVPPVQVVGGSRVRAWSKRDIEKVRKLLPKIRNGRKHRPKTGRQKSRRLFKNSEGGTA